MRLRQTLVFASTTWLLMGATPTLAHNESVH